VKKILLLNIVNKLFYKQKTKALFKMCSFSTLLNDFKLLKWYKEYNNFDSTT